jgi:hypothetical protein
MPRPRRARVLMVAVATTFVLLFATTANSATSYSYKGKTSQKEAISFRLSGGAIRGLDFKIKDRCPDHHILIVEEGGYPPLTIKHSKFGGSFSPTTGVQGEGSMIKGKVSGKTVSGTLTDTGFSQREQRLCHGSATFSLTRK